MNGKEDEPSASNQSMAPRTSVLKGLSWVSAGRASTQILSWVSTITVARILTPEDYGLVGMSATLMGLLLLLTDFGIASAVVAFPDASEDDIGRLQGLALCLSVVGALLGFAGAYPLGLYFNEARLPRVAFIASLSFIPMALTAVPATVLRRDLDFKRVSLVEVAQALASLLTALVLAVLGFGVWALVLNQLLAAIVAAAILRVVRPTRILWPKPSLMTAQLKFTRDIFLQRIGWYVFNSADSVVIARRLGADPLGKFSMAGTISSAPIDKITGLVTSVFSSYFALAQNDRERLRNVYFTLAESLAWTLLPALVGLAMVAEPLVRLALGERWMEIVPLIQLLAMGKVFLVASGATTSLLNMTGSAKRVRQNAIVSAIVFPPAFLLGSYWGLVGVAAVWAILLPIRGLHLMVLACRKLQVPVARLGEVLWRPLVSSAVMCAAVASVAMLASGLLGAFADLASRVLTGAVCYAFMSFVVFRTHTRNLRVVAKSL